MAWVAVSMFAFGLGLILACLSEQSEVVDRVWHTFTYLFFPFSGAVFMVEWLPTSAQGFALLIPTVHGAEWIRHAYFGQAVRTHEQPWYLLAWGLILVAIGLFMTGRLKRRLEPE
jgi:capsular polysaccharide transport system permease protein